MRMLCHPVVKRSQQLTDRMLRLLAQISRNIPSSSTVQGGGKKANASDSTTTSQASAPDSASAGEVQSEAAESR